jgi:murein DD-endopeptidase MepM/ murein hydrolase activator NlpD
VPGYGRVYFFTRDYGSWRSGTIIVTEALEGPMAGYRFRYMHLGAIHPGLQVGDEVEAGQELGLMGGTAIQTDSPHVHIDIEDLDADRVDVAPLLGLPADNSRCTTAR